MSEFVVLVFGQIFTLLALTATCYAAGKLALRGMPFSSAWQELAVSTSIGIGVAGTLLFIIGLCGVLTPTVIVSCAVATHAISFRNWREAGRAIRRSWRRTPPEAATLLPFFGLLPSFVLSLYPPTAYDETAYHLPFAKLFAERHAVVFADTLRFPVFPQLAEMLFTAILELTSDVRTHTVQWLAAFLITAGILSVTRNRSSLLAASVWLGTPLVVFYAASSYVDLVLTLFCTMTWIAWLQFDSTNDRRWLMTSAASAAFAAGTKYLGLYFVAIVLLLVIHRWIRRQLDARAAILAAVVVLVIASPWYGRNAVVTGNPVFPYATPIFGSSAWRTRFDRAAGLQGNAALRLVRGATTLIPTAAEIVMLPSRAIADPLYLGGQPPLSPFMAVLVSLAVIGAARLRPLRVWGIVFACFAIITMRGDVRYLLPIIPFVCLAEAEGALMLARSRLDRLPVVVAIALIAVAPGFAYTTWKIEAKGRPPLTASERDRYLSAAVPAYRALRSLNEHEGTHYVVYGMTGPNARYFAAGRYLGEVTGPASFARVLGEPLPSAQIHANLRSLGAEYLIVDRSLVSRKAARRIARQPAFRLKEQYGDISLYALTP